MIRTSLLAGLFLGLVVNVGTADLIVHYDFNGNALDSSGHGNDGTIVGSPTFVAGQSGQAISFNNPAGQQVATQYVALPGSASILALQNSSFTFAIKYMSTDTSQSNGRLFGGGGPGNGLAFDYNAGGVPETYAVMYDTSGHLLNTLPAVSGNPIAVTTNGQWHWGVMVLDRTAGVLRQYVDSTLVASVSIGTFGAVPLANLNIGRDALNTTYGARLTSVDDFQLFDRALTTDEVRVLVTPEPASLVMMSIGVLVLLGYSGRRLARVGSTNQPV